MYGEGQPEDTPSTSRILLRPPALVLPSIRVVDRDSPLPNTNITCPLICEQGPSAPSSPTPSDRLRRPQPLTVDAMQRINLLATGYDFGKLSPVSPNYATSDLGSSPRSSISVTSANLAPWNVFREQNKSSFDIDDGSSDVCSKDLLSPGMMLSPAPYSPFSDTGRSDTPYSVYGVSPNLSPHVSSRSLNHFNFDLRSTSALSNRHDQLHLLVPGDSLDQLARERSRSDSDMSPKNEQTMLNNSIHSTISVPAASTSQYNKQFLRKYQEEQMRTKPRSSSTPPPSATASEIDDMDLRSVSRQTSRQTTIDDGIAMADDLRLQLEANVLSTIDESRKIEEWMQQQIAAYQAASIYSQVVNSLIVQPATVQLATLSSLPQTSSAVVSSLSTVSSVPTVSIAKEDVKQAVQQQFVCATCGQAFAVHDRLAKHIASRHREKSTTLDDSAKVHRCNICGKSFGRSDMLTRHMRLHTGAKPYNCPTCGQVFSRSDHLSTHLRTHTGEKPYACPLCSYAASRRDMISRHMRTHAAGESLPIDISGPIAQLSLRSASTSPLPPHNISASSSSHDVRLDVAPCQLGIGSGERSAFKPAAGLSSNLLAVPPLVHSLSTPSSPSLSRSLSLLSAPLSRQSSFGLYDDLLHPN